LLKELGYDSDGQYVLSADKKRVIDKYVGVEVTLSKMLIFPGSTIILDDNPLSVAAYFDEYSNDI
jgi:hypothetical protein